MPMPTSRPANKKFAAPIPPDPMVGQKIPAFSLLINGGSRVSDKTLKGKPCVLYFYPKDDTPGCTTEACGFRDALPAFGTLGATVIGVSKDSVASHDKFAAKYSLNFPLASDTDGTTLNAFGVWVEKSMYGKKYMGIDRATFLVDAAGVIRAVWRKVSVPGHVAEVQAALAALAA
jgi:thioredoxin-dependent peroxiredoxin